MPLHPVDTEGQQLPQAPLPEAITIEPYITQADLDQRVKAMADEINVAYAHIKAPKRLVVIAILKGSVFFLTDLVRQINMPCQLEMIRLASYHGGTQSSGQVRAVDLTLPNLTGADVLVVEDIVDTGLTLTFFADYLKSLHHINSLKLAVLLDKPAARLPEAKLNLDFVGFVIDQVFVVGYGLDYDGLYRNLPYIGQVSFDQA
ncbi:MAG: hypoxanthine phosphoribosyltransferase [Vampirovibrionales bacterium]|nr:hypoxanthine phosphoribosyltransferase [Vampirovibrionales bacterium]